MPSNGTLSHKKMLHCLSSVCIENDENTVGLLSENRVRDAAAFEVIVYRAVHFELVTSLSTEEFLEAFKKIHCTWRKTCCSV